MGSTPRSVCAVMIMYSSPVTVLHSVCSPRNTNTKIGPNQNRMIFKPSGVKLAFVLRKIPWVGL